MIGMTSDGRKHRTLRPGLLPLLILQIALISPCTAQLRIDTLLNAQRVSSLVRLKSGDLFLKTDDAVLHSRDDGHSWEALQLPEQMRDVGKIAMVWRDNASGLLHAASSTVAGGYVFAWTEDRGAHWTVDEFIPSERFGFSKTYGAFSPIQLTGDSSFFTIVDARLYGTKDRGRTYYHIEKPGYVNNLHFDGQFGWMQIVRHIRENDTELHVTTDGGATWSQPELPVIVRKFTLHPSGRGILQGGPASRDVYVTAPHEITLGQTGAPEGWELAYSEHSEYIYIDSLHRCFYSSNGRPEYRGHRHTTTYLYFSSDGGERWFRSEAPVALHTAIGIAPGVVLFRTRDDRLLRVTLTDERPFILTAENTSSFDAPRVTLTWSDPSGGNFQTASVERSYAGSEWVHIGTVRPPDQYFIDETLAAGYSVRYRVTLITPSATMRQITDTLTPLPDTFVDFLSYLLPPKDIRITYRYKFEYTWGGNMSGTVEYTYRGATDSTRWLRVHEFDVTYSPTHGDTLRVTDNIHEYRGPWPCFAQPYGFPSYSIFGFDKPIEIDRSDGLRYVFYHPFHVYHSQEALPQRATDSMHFAQDAHMWNSPRIEFSAVRGKGLLRKHYSCSEIDEMGWESRMDVTWERIEATNNVEPFSSADIVDIHVYPNPVSTSATIEYRVHSNGPVRISVHDMLGREVALLLYALRSAGEYSVAFDASVLPAGMYICRVVTGGGSSSALLQRLR
jgi:hypothetical protein